MGEGMTRPQGFALGWNPVPLRGDTAMGRAGRPRAGRCGVGVGLSATNPNASPAPSTLRLTTAPALALTTLRDLPG